MTIGSSNVNELMRDDYEKRLAAYWDAKQNDAINLLLGKEDGLYHHHFGIGDFDRSIADLPAKEREQQVLDWLHRLENAQVKTLIDLLGDVRRGERVLDQGAGRGGTSFMIYDRFGCHVDGVNFSRYQVDFAARQARLRRCDQQVRFHFQNMVHTFFPTGHFNHVVTNETTPYVDLSEIFGEISRVLRQGGRYVAATWCRNDAVAETCREVEEIDEHYICRTHRRSSYFKALAANRLVPRTVVDFTVEATPYFELRFLTKLQTGSEEPYLSGYRSGKLNYMMFVADRV